MEKYSNKEQEWINKTLKVAQDKGWNANADPMQFYIIVGEKLERHENVLKSKYAEIKEMEEALDKKIDEVDQIKTQLNSKETELDSLEAFVKERVIEINQLRENNKSMANQIFEAIKLENKVEIQSAIILELKDELKEKEEAENKAGDEIDGLKKEIKVLESNNCEKIKALDDVTNENEVLREKLQVLEQKNSESLLKETNNIGGIDAIEEFKCGDCGKEFVTLINLKKHKQSDHESSEKTLLLNLKLSELESKLSEQKQILLTNIMCLKEKEFKEKQLCSCRGWCGINHEKHNWRPSQSEIILSTLKSMN